MPSRLYGETANLDLTEDEKYVKNAALELELKIVEMENSLVSEICRKMRLAVSFRRVVCDPPELDVGFKRALNEFAQSARYGIEHYAQAWLWRLMSFDNRVLNPNMVDREFSIQFSDYSDYFYHSQVGPENILVILDPFFCEIATNFIPHIKKVARNVDDSSAAVEILGLIQKLENEYRYMRFPTGDLIQWREAQMEKLILSVKRIINLYSEISGGIDLRDDEAYKIWIRPGSWDNNPGQTLDTLTDFEYGSKADRVPYVSSKLAVLRDQAVPYFEMLLNPRPSESYDRDGGFDISD